MYFYVVHDLCRPTKAPTKAPTEVPTTRYVTGSGAIMTTLYCGVSDPKRISIFNNNLFGA